MLPAVLRVFYGEERDKFHVLRFDKEKLKLKAFSTTAVHRCQFDDLIFQGHAVSDVCKSGIIG
jgi:hypothetical protein